MDSLPPDYVPELRARPPWLMEEMVAAEPALAGEILGAGAEAAAIAALVSAAAHDGAPIVVAGCGTSETAAMAVADLLSAALQRSSARSAIVHARQALEANLDPWPGGLCLGISHEGSTRATILAMEAARAGGAATALLTARADAPATRAADRVFVTPLIDRSWCHTVGYLSPLLAGAAVGEALRSSPLDRRALESFLREVLALAPQAAGVARAFDGVDRVLLVGAGYDRSPARELALKIEEGARLPARMLDLETLLHGHLAACDGRTALVLVATGGAGRILTRAGLAASAARRIGMRVGAILSEAADAALDETSTDAGRIVLPSSAGGLGLIGRLAGAALGLQQLTIALARVRGTNPDLIRREEEPYREAAAIAEGNATW